MKPRFITSRFGMAAAVVLLASMISLLRGGWLASRCDLPAYDLAMGLRQGTAAPVVLVEVGGGDATWPVSRRSLAAAVERIKRAGAETVVIAFPLRGRDPAAAGVGIIRSVLLDAVSGRERVRLERRLKKAEEKLDGDRLLAAAIRDGGVVLGVDARPGRAALSLPAWFTGVLPAASPPRAREVLFANPWPQPLFAGEYSLALPLPELLRAASAAGHLAPVYDHDRLVRGASPFVRAGGVLVPSLALAAMLDYRSVRVRDVGGIYGRRRIIGLTVGGRTVSLSPTGTVLADFAALAGLERLSAAELADAASARLKGRIAVVGPPSAAGVRAVPTPAGLLSPAEFEAAVIASLTGPSPVRRPPWAWIPELGVMIYLFFFAALAVPRMGTASGAFLFLFSSLAWAATAGILFAAGGIWLRAVTPLVPAFSAWGMVFFFRASSLREMTDPAAIEDNRKVGLALQGQGMVDLAMERFMRLPASDPANRELLYNLALDLERRRMFAKAAAVYEHVEKHGGHRDSRDRLRRARQAERTPGLAPSLGPDATVTMNAGLSTPTIGRYEVVKELGRGAIGTVYLGRDPRINREVAIKTLRSSEVSIDELDEVRERFFREAEAAGRLNHPNIVTIYDVGEDDDLIYIAMEVLRGHDLTGFCRKGNLLPVDEVLRIIIQVGAALDYAHSNNIVHRDIKPANIVMSADGQIKVADFGIAHLQASSTFTQTGAILGTPNYMSPEQVSGRKVDGRSDLFSLGVVFYELLSGVKPFSHENVATLMNQIAKASCTPLAELRPDLPDCCCAVVAKLLARAKSRRYQNAADLVDDCRACLASLGR